MDAFERCGAKIDDITDKLCKQIDDVNAGLAAQRQYNRDTFLIFLCLWGISLPATFLIALNVALRLSH